MRHSRCLFFTFTLSTKEMPDPATVRLRFTEHGPWNTSNVSSTTLPNRRYITHRHTLQLNLGHSVFESATQPGLCLLLKQHLPLPYHSTSEEKIIIRVRTVSASIYVPVTICPDHGPAIWPLSRNPFPRFPQITNQLSRLYPTTQSILFVIQKLCMSGRRTATLTACCN